MSKYADIEQIKEVIRKEWVKYMPSDLDINLSFVLGKIAEVPTIDIVHCKDCKHVTYKINPTRSQDVFYACHYSEIQHDGDFYCAYGERKDNE